MIINLSKGRIGETNANLLGGMLITKIYLAALSRADVPDRVLKTLPNFYLFVDEFQSFANESFADILSEARKYKLNLTIAHQYIEQMEEEVRAAVFGNVGTMIIFRVGAYDAEILEKEFAPQFTAEDIVNLGIFQIYLKLMIDGVSSVPFSASTLGPIALPETSSAQEAITMSRSQFSSTRADVEKAIADWHIPIAPPPRATKPSASSATSAPLQAPTSISAPQPAKIVIPPMPAQAPAPASVPVKKPSPAPVPKPISKPATPPQPVSLSSLSPKPKPTGPLATKDATPERVSELRNALASVLGSAPKPQKKEEVKKAPESPKPAPKNQSTSNEVSEDVLKNILKVE
jgi:hypothetical protein